jgi:hypothetical protein
LQKLLQAPSGFFGRLFCHCGLIMPRPQRFCIFCGRPGLTKEHIWADWLKSYIKKDEPSHEEFSIFFPTPGPTNETETKKRSGDVRRRTVKIVCGPCNGGWMSRLQERTKPILLPLLEGQAATLSPAQQRTLTAWAAMVIMVGNYMKHETQVSSTQEREWLRLKEEPPENWQLWIANLATDAHAWVSNRFPLSLTENITYSPDKGRPQPNMQTTSFVVGKLFLYGFSFPFPEIAALRQFTEADERELIIPIWPNRQTDLHWPPSRTMTREQSIEATTKVLELVTRAAQRG